MKYTVNLGCWGSIFAVPTDVVDKYLKIAGSAQLKVLLYILRRSGEEFDSGEIAASLNMDSFDVKDCIEFWSSFGIIAVRGGTITPAQNESANTVITERREEAPSAPMRIPSPEPSSQRPAEIPAPQETQRIPEKNEPEKISPVVAARPLRPDPVYVAKRVHDDQEIKALLEEAQYTLGRPISPNENAGLIMLHDNEGLPCEVILMLLNYGAENKKGMKQIEAMGASWAKEGILTVEQADEKIRRLEESKEAYRRIQSLLGLEFRKASEKENEMYTRWLNIWKFSDEMIREAYDRCVNAKGKYLPNYVNTILNNWYDKGIKTTEQIPRKPSGNSSQGGGRASSFDIDELNRLSMFDD